MIRLVLVDDHPVVRAGLRALLEGQGDLDVVAEASDTTAAVDIVERFHPDVLHSAGRMELTRSPRRSGCQSGRCRMDERPVVRRRSTLQISTRRRRRRQLV